MVQNKENKPPKGQRLFTYPFTEKRKESLCHGQHTSRSIQFFTSYIIMAVVSRVKRKSCSGQLLFAGVILTFVSLGLLSRNSVEYYASLLVGSASTSFSSSTSSSPSSSPLSLVNHAALKRTSGEGWEMWNRKAVSTFCNYTCGWATFNATNGEMAQMCIHPGPDIVS
jgi:hypothetical protein